MKRILFFILILSVFLFAEEIVDSSTENPAAVNFMSVDLPKVSLSAAETCPSDSIVSSNYAKCQQALKIVINSQFDKQEEGQSMARAATMGSFVGGILIGLLLGWRLL